MHEWFLPKTVAIPCFIVASVLTGYESTNTGYRALFFFHLYHIIQQESPPLGGSSAKHHVVQNSQTLMPTRAQTNIGICCITVNCGRKVWPTHQLIGVLISLSLLSAKCSQLVLARYRSFGPYGLQ